MINKINEIIEKLNKEIKEISNLEQLKQIKAKYLTKSSFYIELKNKIKISKEKKEIGNLLKIYLFNINEILNKKKFELENSFFIKKRENPITNNKKRMSLVKSEGSFHPLTIITKQLMNFFDNLNYNYSNSIEIDDEKFNFNILNLKKNHPAREMQDTFYLENGKLLRTHATNMSARELFFLKKDDYNSYSIGPVFRNDDNDATHSFQFTQIDIFNNGNDKNIANLKWTLNELMNHIFKKKLIVKYRPSYFPFTEPSYETDVQCPNCLGKKCSVCSNTGWIEILGCGMFSPIVFKNVGIDPNKSQGWAAGIGIERIAMIKWSIIDIRNFYSNDIDFLMKFKGEK